ncbi:hypothetical protein GVN16_05820 [Emticicia sp. CRIBPO]|uniref:VanZ family protein n=1 Tax=Emticicia sp. CRIBPO TaxID=2683258 RepID=UPI0014122F31|nr:VanZ family protein [Emticicia sp. CRIBPO]NBA85268.1 hypothetical protein [Emticicia sp. CRIBPO]
MLRIFLIFLAFLLVLSVFYFSWIAYPDLREAWFLPGWVMDWANESRNGDLRTAVPFFLLGIVFELLMKKSNNWMRRLGFWFLLFVLVVVVEVGQLRLPHRHFSYTDIFWGVAGTTAGMLIGGFLNFLFTPEGE